MRKPSASAERNAHQRRTAQGRRLSNRKTARNWSADLGWIMWAVFQSDGSVVLARRGSASVSSDAVW